MSLTRDDMLRELELLPAWQLRQPVTNSAPHEVIEMPKLSAIAEPEVKAVSAQFEELPATQLIETETIAAVVENSLPALDVTLGQGRREAIMQLDWQGVQDCVANCQACDLAKTRTQTVFGVGDPNADWLIVGEAPGSEEDRKGEPFVGQAGKLLDNMLAAIKLKRGQNVFIANVLKCRPPENRNPHADEVAMCDPFLKRQVEIIKPKLIIALGKFAAQSLLGSEDTISSMRGKLHDFHGVPVVVTYHPAYLLRSLPEKAKAWEDLCFANKTMAGLRDSASANT
jgi:DNA polymerase